MNSLIPSAHWRFGPSAWTSRWSTPHLIALVIGGIIFLPAIMGGTLWLIFWFIGNVLFQPMFWVLLIGFFLYLLFVG